ncbi:hypothetical protein AB7W87_11010 [Providencia alcalifaciens]
MNEQIMKKLFFNRDETFDSLITICENNNPLITVLTLHLTCESFLEAYICAHLEIEDLFSESPNNKEDVKFRMSFEHKAKLAQRLGMPKAAYNAFEILGQIRNQFAHRLLQSEIPDSYIGNLYSLINSIPNHGNDLDLNDEGIRYYSKDGVEQFAHKFNDEQTPKSMKLLVAFFSLIRRVSPAAE